MATPHTDAHIKSPTLSCLLSTLNLRLTFRARIPFHRHWGKVLLSGTPYTHLVDIRVPCFTSGPQI